MRLVLLQIFKKSPSNSSVVCANTFVLPEEATLQFSSQLLPLLLLSGTLRAVCQQNEIWTQFSMSPARQVLAYREASKPGMLKVHSALFLRPSNQLALT